MATYFNEIDPQKAAWLRELIKRDLIAKGDVDERSIADVRPDDLRGYQQCHFFAGIGIWSHSGSPDGLTTAKSGREAAPASPSARPAKPKRSTMKGIFGQSCFDSSKHDDLSFALASRLRASTGSLGSTLFALTWTVRVTPAGRSICALRASEPRIEGSVCTGWPTPSATENNMSPEEWERLNAKQRSQNPNLHEKQKMLSTVALMSAWPTPDAHFLSARSVISPKLTPQDKQFSLADASSLTGWPTPQKHDERERGNTMADHHYFPHDLSNAAQMASWITPQSKDFRCGQEKRYIEGVHAVSLNDQVQMAGWPTARATDAEKNVRTPEGAMREMERKGGPQDLMQAALLTAWGTPAARDWKNGNASQETLDKNARPLNELAQLTAWQSPTVNDSRNSEYTYSQGNHENPFLKLPGGARLTAFGDQPIGFLLGPSGWEIVPASGQLNPAHSRWLMGLPPAWCACAVTAMASWRKSRKRSSERGSPMVQDDDSLVNEGVREGSLTPKGRERAKEG